MGFTSGQFQPGERVQVRRDTRHHDYITFAGMNGVIAESSNRFRTWHKGDVGYDYAYLVRFDVPQDDRLSDHQRSKLVRMGEQTWLPGRYLEPATTTLFIRKTEGRWRDVDGLPQRSGFESDV